VLWSIGCAMVAGLLLVRSGKNESNFAVLANTGNRKNGVELVNV